MNKEEYVELEVPKEYITQGIKEPVWVHSTTHFEMMENVGALRYIEGATYPAKGIPTPEKVQGVNIIKSIITESIKYAPLFIFINKNKLFSSFNRITNRILKSTVTDHIAVPHQYLCATAHGVYSIIAHFMVNLGVDEEIAENTAYNVAHIFEHDDAWRYRVQDMATEANIDNLFDNPVNEINRLLELYKQRQDRFDDAVHHYADTPHVGKIRKMVTLVKYALYIPVVRKSFMNTIRFIKSMEYDESDWYWVCFRDDYNYGGKTVEERSRGLVPPKQYLMS